MNEKKPDIIDRRAIGDITRSGGISNVVHQAERGIITVIYKQNEPVAVVLPCDRSREQLYTNVSIVASLSHVSRDNSFDGATASFLLNLVELGSSAHELLRIISHGGNQQSAQSEFLQELEAVSVKNSSEGGGSVPPMTTARADVSEVKTAGEDESPAPSRKRGASKKPSSSPSKRKIGTQREIPS